MSSNTVKKVKELQKLAKRLKLPLNIKESGGVITGTIKKEPQAKEKK